MRVWRPTTGCPPRGAARSRQPPPCPPSTCQSTPPTTLSSSHPTLSPYSPPTPSPRHTTTSSPHPIPRSSPPPRTPRCRITPPRRSRLLPRITRLRGRRPLRPPNRRGNRVAAAAVGPLPQPHNSSSSNSSSWPCSISNSSRRPTRPRLSITTARPWWPIWRRESRTPARCIGTIRPPSRCSRRAECFPRRPWAITRPPP